MKKVLFILMALTLAACSKTETVIMQGPPGADGAAGPKGDSGEQGPAGQDGHDGANGTNGANGHSLVSQYVGASAMECPNGGSRLDIYLDADDSLGVSADDTFMSSIIACNGANGLDGLNGADGAMGPQGAPGPQGIAGAVGPQGTPGAQGLIGPSGPAGSQGPQGIQGPAGNSGATITAYTSSACTQISSTGVYTKQTGNQNVAVYSTPSCDSQDKLAEIGSGESYWVSSNDLAVWTNGSIRVIHFN